MDTIEKQIQEYRYEATDGAKPRIVEELSWTEDERILPFLLEVLADVDEPELARIEAARALTPDMDAMSEDICDVLLTVLQRADEDGEVLRHAIEAAEAFLGDSDDLLAAIAALQSA